MPRTAPSLRLADDGVTFWKCGDVGWRPCCSHQVSRPGHLEPEDRPFVNIFIRGHVYASIYLSIHMCVCVCVEGVVVKGRTSGEWMEGGDEWSCEAPPRYLRGLAAETLKLVSPRSAIGGSDEHKGRRPGDWRLFTLVLGDRPTGRPSQTQVVSGEAGDFTASET
ncbi:unnamed protein product [Protopolystoma xenopodis]|uniref:Uncharacterized protein n=1 Tax=Protopolystoma xenopodis TaxID=117903 RepID=A0A448WPB3_9PLAT|nr:unnamed protein product [Protopolystoma xenopodis]